MPETAFARQRDLRYKALADPTRRHLLRLLEDFAGPTEVATLAKRVDLHVNTVRGHLEILEEAQLVERVVEERDRPGRPKILFRARPADNHSPDTEGYRFLAEVLASSIQAMATHPDTVAEEAGRAWGSYLVDRPAPFEKIEPHRAVEQVLTTLAELGFEPDSATEANRTVIRLHDCPFREMARTRGTIVCSVHRGLLQGMLEELSGSVQVESLEPFVEPSLCIARLVETGR